jgi:hypothetical protein
MGVSSSNPHINYQKSDEQLVSREIYIEIGLLSRLNYKTFPYLFQIVFSSSIDRS